MPEGAPYRDVEAIDVWLFYGVIAILAVFGGSSRYDMAQNVILQPTLWIVLGVVAFRSRRPPELRPYIWLSIAYGIWLALQLVPLPFEVWSVLSGREEIARLDEMLIGENWRPLSLVPARTLNAFALLPAILAPIVAFGNLGSRALFHGTAALVGCAVFSGLLGLVQIASGAGYFYSITNLGSMVGLFANSNHAAVYGSCGIVLASIAVTWADHPLQRTLLCSSIGFLFLAMIGNGSRAGLVTLAIAMLVVFFVALASVRSDVVTKGNAKTSLIVGALLLLALVTIGSFISSGKITALNSLVNEDPFGDLRFRIAPVLVEILTDFFPFGSGIGTFEEVFYMYEPNQLLQPTYVNMAHNDWLQVLIEGGLVGALFIVALLGMLARSIFTALTGLGRKRQFALVIGLGSMFAIVALASAFDYPLRTPLFQATFVLMVAMLAFLPRRSVGELAR